MRRTLERALRLQQDSGEKLGRAAGDARRRSRSATSPRRLPVQLALPLVDAGELSRVSDSRGARVSARSCAKRARLPLREDDDRVGARDGRSDRRRTRSARSRW